MARLSQTEVDFGIVDQKTNHTIILENTSQHRVKMAVPDCGSCTRVTLQHPYVNIRLKLGSFPFQLNGDLYITNKKVTITFQDDATEVVTLKAQIRRP